ncbi:hypothetical protein GCM10020331_013780 [Ectobacillus funiculus]
MSYYKKHRSFLGIPFESFYQDWNYNTNSGILLLVNNDFNPDVKIDESFERKLFPLVRMVGSQLHKIPSGLKVVKYTHNICVVESKEIMLPLEHLLLEQGNIDLLLTHAAEIKKRATFGTENYLKKHLMD